ncbi:hypothetical protein AKO1_011475 [Acrasis kona]|uniref:Peptidase S1 domain-containing protein n=1 Tax=Acrasis kona TaxID=1008807 RepID=A0AAW2Z3S1_9EUKA
MHKSLLALTICLTVVYSIYNGVEVKQGEYPYLVYLMVDPGTPKTYACGAGIISSRYVMSAGHCSFGDFFQVIVGRIDVRGYRRTDLYNITKANRPLDFGKDGLFDYNDIAIYELEKPIDEVENYTQYMDIAINAPPVGEPIHVAGFGQLAGPTGTSKVHHGVTHVAPDNDCKTFDDYRTEVAYCTNDTNLYCCPGDSGSPFVVKPSGSTRWVSVGINSYGKNGQCGFKSPESVVADVSTMTEFIKQHTTLAPPNFVTVKYTNPLSTTKAPQTTNAPTTINPTTIEPTTLFSQAPTKSDEVKTVETPTSDAGVIREAVAYVVSLLAVVTAVFM